MEIEGIPFSPSSFLPMKGGKKNLGKKSPTLEKTIYNTAVNDALVPELDLAMFWLFLARQEASLVSRTSCNFVYWAKREREREDVRVSVVLRPSRCPESGGGRMNIRNSWPSFSFPRFFLPR